MRKLTDAQPMCLLAPVGIVGFNDLGRASMWKMSDILLQEVLKSGMQF